MKYYRVDGQPSRLVVDDGDQPVNLTSVDRSLTTFGDLVEAVEGMETSIDGFAAELAKDAPAFPMEGNHQLQLPVVPKEVWAAGVTYQISEKARKAESGTAGIYLDVYDGDRPELFLKATPNRTVPPADEVGIRSDSTWNVPEPELGIVLYDEEIVGYTIGNDMSSRSIEGTNPLYLPQAKVYDRCCSLGPCVATPQTVGDPHDLDMTMTISRDGTTVYEDSTNTSKMVRSCEELASFLVRHNVVPDPTVLLTGTSLVPDDEFTLEPADEITIWIENIGELHNPVVNV